MNIVQRLFNTYPYGTQVIVYSLALLTQNYELLNQVKYCGTGNKFLQDVDAFLATNPTI